MAKTTVIAIKLLCIRHYKQKVSFFVCFFHKNVVFRCPDYPSLSFDSTNFVLIMFNTIIKPYINLLIKSNLHCHHLITVHFITSE